MKNVNCSMPSLKNVKVGSFFKIKGIDNSFICLKRERDNKVVKITYASIGTDDLHCTFKPEDQHIEVEYCADYYDHYKIAELINKLKCFREVHKVFDRGHNEKHFDEVFDSVAYLYAKSKVNKRLALDVNYLGINLKAALIAAAFHDLGLMYGRKYHEIASIMLLEKALWLKEYADKETINKAKEIIAKHRKSKYNIEECDESCIILRDADSISCSDKDRYLERFVGFNLDMNTDIPVTVLTDKIYKFYQNKKHNWDPGYIYSKYYKGSTGSLDISLYDIERKVLEMLGSENVSNFAGDGEESIIKKAEDIFNDINDNLNSKYKNLSSNIYVGVSLRFD